MKKIAVTSILIIFILAPLGLFSGDGIPLAEFAQRRAELMKQLDTGMVILFAGADSPPATRFRQDNDFYYLTGCEDKNAICVLIPKLKQGVLFLPSQTERETRFEGKNLLNIPGADKKWGFAKIYPVAYFNEFMARSSRLGDGVFYVRLSAGDGVSYARRETSLNAARRARNPYNNQITLDQFRVRKLREVFPEMEMKDVTPSIDRMRLIKSPAEIKILRRNGRISAEAIRKAMKATRPGVYEYELEGIVMGEILRNGCNGPAYPPIIGSGPNSCIYHYSRSSRQMKDGEVILMDFGGDLSHLCMDITRTWPVSGKFTPEQRKVYQAVLEVQKESIKLYKPGITSKDVEKHVADLLKKKGIDPMGLRGGIHHFVGMSVHDVGPRGVVLEAGMVFTFEPALYFPEKNLGIRIEDTILITKNGHEVLSKDVPKEIDEIEALMSR